MYSHIPFKALIVDDNPIARLLLRQLLGQIPSVEVSGECATAAEAVILLNQSAVDILFLDIEMPGMSGIELLQSLPVRPLTILTTGSNTYGPEAFDLNVVDYLVKPLSLPRTLMAVNRALELLRQRDVYLNSVEGSQLFIKENKVIRKLQMDDIFLLESKGDYVKIYVAGKNFVVHATMKMLEERLPPGKFMRVHRSFIVALDKIDYIEENTLYINNTPVPVSESYRGAFLKKLNLI